MLNSIINFFTKYISEIAFTLSVINAVYSYRSSKANLKAKFRLYEKPIIENEHYVFLFDCELFNKSKYPITITKITFNNHPAYNHTVELGYGSETVFGQEIYGKGCTQHLPFKLDLFDSINTTFLIRDRKQIKYHHINLIKIYTSRGIMYYFNFKKKL